MRNASWDCGGSGGAAAYDSDEEDSEPRASSSEDAQDESSLNEHAATGDDDSWDREDFKREIEGHLDAIGDGTFATSGALPASINPGLDILGLGRVGLPLSERDAKSIIDLSHEAPFGKGSETLVDETVRRTWEIDPGKIRFRNLRFPNLVQHAIGKCTEELGVSGGQSTVHAVLHKLLLYEKGGFFKAHRDTEKAPNMFATLIIMLPSEHEGGEVMVQHCNRKETLPITEPRKFGYPYLAWYADVEHSIVPVTSGYCLVLTYNLFHTSIHMGFIRPESVMDDHRANLNRALSRWRHGIDYHGAKSNALISILQHQYSESNFGLSSLKGTDQLRAVYLQDVCKTHGN